MPTPRTERIEFSGASGHRLAGRLEHPSGDAVAFSLFAHCFTCSKDLKATRRISHSLAEQGIAVLRFDFTGLGESEGEFSETNFSSNVDDLVAAADFLRDRFQAPQLLLGHSLGGTAAIAAASRVPEVRAVATIAAPSDTDHLREVLIKKAPSGEHGEEFEVDLAGRSFRIQPSLLEDLAEQSVREAIGELRKPLLIFHSPRDRVVGIEHARRIFEAAKHPKSFVSLDEADHLLLERQSDSRFVAEVLASWAKRYVQLRQPDSTAEAEREPGEVVVTGGPSGLRQQVFAGSHQLLADEPVKQGGNDAGPNPYEFLLASLGSCTAMTLRMYADRKDWPLEEILVRLKHSRLHAKDCDDCETAEGKIDRIERVLELQGKLSDEQLKRLVEIADRCPVSRTLTSETKIATRLG